MSSAVVPTHESRRRDRERRSTVQVFRQLGATRTDDGCRRFADGRRFRRRRSAWKRPLASTVFPCPVAPALPRFGVRWSPWHESGDGPFRYVEGKHEHLAVNPWRTPGRVLGGHPADQGAELGCRRRSPRASTPRLPGPVLPKALSVPTYDRLRLDDQQGLLPPWPEPAERDPEESIHQTHHRSRSLGREDRELLAKREVLDQEARP